MKTLKVFMFLAAPVAGYAFARGWSEGMAAQGLMPPPEYSIEVGFIVCFAWLLWLTFSLWFIRVISETYAVVARRVDTLLSMEAQYLHFEQEVHAWATQDGSHTPTGRTRARAVEAHKTHQETLEIMQNA